MSTHDHEYGDLKEFRTGMAKELREQQRAMGRVINAVTDNMLAEAQKQSEARKKLVSSGKAIDK